MYSVKDIAEKLKLKDTTIRKYINQGRLEAYKFGRQYMVSEEDLKNFLEKQKK